jgi:hypothetical protein
MAAQDIFKIQIPEIAVALIIFLMITTGRGTAATWDTE